MSDLKKILFVIQTIKSAKIQWDEVAIGIATLGFGASISAILSNLKIATTLCVYITQNLKIYVKFYHAAF